MNLETFKVMETTNDNGPLSMARPVFPDGHKSKNLCDRVQIPQEAEACYQHSVEHHNCAP